MLMGKVAKVSGPVVVGAELKNAKIGELVRVGDLGLVGEIIGLKGDKGTIQVYEETSGLKIGDKVELSGSSLSVELGPGLLSSIYDGIERPLDFISKTEGDFISRGVMPPALNRDKIWDFSSSVKKGSKVKGGYVLGEVEETELIKHSILVPPYVEGKIKDIHEGKAKIDDTIATLDDGRELKMFHSWPIRIPRPVSKKISPDTLLVTGQRVIDTFFPLAKGGSACIPGPFGSGKTVVQHQLAKWSDADVIIFVGCGERGNEMANLLIEFGKLKDPKTDRSLMERTIMIANTSNMPFAAREASVYTGITIAGYFRDMGYNTLLNADSTSRWAEALREISGGLEEMPGGGGYPAYLASRISSFYERSGYVNTLAGGYGSVTLVGSVSPPGGDLAEPVTQNTLRTTKVFWALDSALAYSRHFPAIHWLDSYSLYLTNLEGWFRTDVSEEWLKYRNEAMVVLQKESELEEMVRLVGIEALSQQDRLLLEVARHIREDFLYQNAFIEDDTYTSVKKQFKMLELIINFYNIAREALEKGWTLTQVMELKIRNDLTKSRSISEDKLEIFEHLNREMVEQFKI